MKTLLTFVFAFLGGLLIGIGVERIWQKIKMKKNKEKKNEQFNITDEMIIRFAHLKGGIISTNELTLQTSLSMEEAQRRLESLVAKQMAELRISNEGKILYDFTKATPNNIEKRLSEKI